MTLPTQMAQVVICRICHERMVDHFKSDGTWQGCIELTSPMVLVVPEPRMMRMHQATSEFGRQGEGMRGGAVVNTRAARVKYMAKKATDSAMKKLHGQVKQVFIVLSEHDDGMTAADVIQATGFPKPSVQHALWKLKQDGLAKTVAP